MELYCKQHDRLFSNKSNFNRHFREQHNFISRSFPLFCSLCERSFSTNQNRINHLKSEHSQDIDIVNLVFDTFDDFKKWKVKEEKSNDLFFRTTNSCDLKKDGDKIYYFCNKNPTNFKRTIQMTSTSTVQMNKNYCTSSLIIELNSKRYNLTYIKSHYGHLNLKNSFSSNNEENTYDTFTSEDALNSPESLASNEILNSNKKNLTDLFFNELISQANLSKEVHLNNETIKNSPVEDVQCYLESIKRDLIILRTKDNILYNRTKINIQTQILESLEKLNNLQN